MDQEYPAAIQEKSIRLGRILNYNDEKADLEQEVNKLIHLTKPQRLVLISFIKKYKHLFAGNLGEWTGPPVDITLKNKAKPYHARYLPILIIHIEPLKKYLDRIVAIGGPLPASSFWIRMVESDLYLISGD